jgi:ABC-type dipeptide/oligopeptide/nickel transport system ATPase component
MPRFASTARAVLFGRKQNNDLTFGNVALAAIWRLFGGEAKDKPTVGQYVGHLGVRTLQGAFGIRNERTVEGRLPGGWPADVFAIIAKEIEAKGGTIKLEDGAIIPAFRLTANGAVVLPHMYVAYIKPTSQYSDYKKAAGLDEPIEESLAQKGKHLAVRVMSKPLRVEVERPDAELISLADDWELLKAQPTNQYEYTFGTYFADKSLKIGVADLLDPNECHAAIVGMSGSGKTQLAMSIILTAALNTSPEHLSMVVIDPKNLDFSPLAGLPHLANGSIIYDLDTAANAVRLVVAEMDRRTAAGKQSVTQKRIMLFIDELPDLLDQDRQTDGESLESALVRLLQKGRGVGINVFIAAQQAKKEVVSTRVLENMSWRMVGSVNTYYASTHASGQEGCLAHKLPGKGSFLMYNPEFRNGVRVQSHFVAEPKRSDYTAVIGNFVADINERWQGIRPHWAIVQPLPAQQAMVQDELPMDVNTKPGRPTTEFDGKFILTIMQERKAGGISINAVRKLHQTMHGTDCGHKRAKELLDLLG